MEMPIKQLSLRTLLLWWVMNVIKINIFHMTKITNPSDWCFDSGATLHVCNYEAQFKTYEEFFIELRYLWTSTIRQKFMESALLKWNWVLARSSLNQHYIFMYLISRKTNFLLRMVLSKNGILVGNEYVIILVFFINMFWFYLYC